MNEDLFEGSLVLEMLAEHGLVDDFFEAIDSDDFTKAVFLMRTAQVDDETIRITLKKMRDSNHQN